MAAARWSKCIGVEEHSVKNVARDKETLQSTLSMRSSDIIVDGDRDQNLEKGSCINIEKKGESWLQVDLGDMYTVFNIRVFLADPGDNLEDCFEQPWTYRGNANTTESGFPCQPWNITHDIFHYMPPDSFGFRVGENYCRSANLDYRYYFWCRTHIAHLKRCDIQLRNQKLWCYTTNPELEWEYCAVKKCVKASTSNVILKIGTTESNIETPEFMDNSGLSENILEFVLHNNPQARYVEIHQDYTTDYFPLCEVEVYGISNDTINAALHKPAELSSVYGDFGPHLAVDGIRTKSSYFATEKELNPWWRVDLSGIYVVFLIRLFNRLDCCIRLARREALGFRKLPNCGGHLRRFQGYMTVRAYKERRILVTSGSWIMDKTGQYHSPDDDTVCNSLKNVARNKETFQSSTLTTHSCSIIVDGDRDQNLENGSCINIEKKGESRWILEICTLSLTSEYFLLTKLL
ncbi:uncharacterized protein LOC132724655 [Ruditapes philippinarum]|uniref:uncharacterized protein LOC132724655 n=1 Tax=Ruditapes philippinarum TaxID=129788 RepID=UPI00295AA016|nr:uncharacterized protein LOC132724655 [Ruditapes philippinarum]